MGVADIYGEVRDTGVGDRGTAALGAIPYAALETLPEFFLAGRIFGLGPDVLKSGGAAKRAGKGLFVGGTLEGLTELGQEAIILTGTDQLGDAETTKRLINSFAAGFAIGGPIGTGVNLLRRGEPTDLINEENPQADQKLLPAPPEETPPPSQGQGQLPPPAGPAALLTGPPSQDPAFPGPQFVAGEQGVEQVPQQGELFPQQDLGQQSAQANERVMLTPSGVQEVTTERTPQVIAAEAAAQPQPTQAELEAAGQLPLASTDPTGFGVQAAVTPETEQTAIGQQLLQAANNRIQEQQNQIAEEQRIRQEAEERAQRQREFDLAEQQRLNQQVAQLENARVEQILKENERLTQEVEERKAREQAQIPVPQRTPTQLRFPGMAVPYSARRQALRRGAAAAPVVAEPTAAELEQAGQMTLPFPEPPASEIAPLVERMLADNIPIQNIQEYIDDFQAAIDNNDLVEQDNIIAEMEGVVESFNRPRRTLSARPVVEETGQPVTASVLTGQTPLERVGRGQEETRVDPETGEEFTVISYPPLPTPQRRTDAVQEQSTDEVAVRQQTEPSSEVRRGDAERRQTARENKLQEQLRKATARQTENFTKEEQRAIREANQEARRQQIQKSTSLEAILEKPMIPVQGRTPQEMWDELSTGVAIAYTRLPKEFRDTWNQYVAGDTVNGDLAALINQNAYLELDSRNEREGGLTDLDRVDEYIGAFDTTTDFSRHGTAWSYSNQLVAVAFFEPDVNSDARAKAVRYLKDTTFSPQQQNALDTAFINTINTGDTKKGIVNGKNAAWLEYATRRSLEGEITVALTAMPAWFTSPQAAVIKQTVADTQQQGEVLGQETADTMLKLLRRRQALGETIDFSTLSEAYDESLGKSGRKKAREVEKEFQ